MIRFLIVLALLCMTVDAFATGAPPVDTCNSGGGTGTQGDCFLGSNIVAGDLVVCTMPMATDTGKITDGVDFNGSNVYVVVGPARNGSGNSIYMMYSLTVSGGSGAHIVAHADGSYFIDMACQEYSGMAATNASVFDSSSTANGTSATQDGGSVTPTASDDLFIGATVDNTTGDSFTAGAGYTIRNNLGHGFAESFAIEDANSTSCTAQSAPITGTNSSFAAITIAFKTSSPATCATTPVTGLNITPGAGKMNVSQGAGSLVIK